MSPQNAGPPAGIDLSENHNTETIVAVIALMLLGVGAMALRLVSRRYTPVPEGLRSDDWYLMTALVFALGNGACCLAIVPYGGGKHIWALSAAEIAAVFKITWVLSEVYATCVTLTKISILLFYERIFGRTWTTRGRLTLAFLFWVANTVVFLAGCRPLSYFWDRYVYPSADSTTTASSSSSYGAGAPEGHCIHTQEYNLWIGVCDVIIDALVLLVPIPYLYRLRITWKQKAGVLGIFMLGIIALIAGVQRVVTMKFALSGYDLTWQLSCAYVWTCAEPMVGIICACLPTYAILFRRLQSVYRARTSRNGFTNDLESRPDKADLSGKLYDSAITLAT